VELSSIAFKRVTILDKVRERVWHGRERNPMSKARLIDDDEENSRNTAKSQVAWRSMCRAGTTRASFWSTQSEEPVALKLFLGVVVLSNTGSFC
jgi:hypothetical protein